MATDRPMNIGRAQHKAQQWRNTYSPRILFVSSYDDMPFTQAMEALEKNGTIPDITLIEGMIGALQAKRACAVERAVDSRDTARQPAESREALYQYSAGILLNFALNNRQNPLPVRHDLFEEELRLPDELFARIEAFTKPENTHYTQTEEYKTLKDDFCQFLEQHFSGNALDNMRRGLAENVAGGWQRASDFYLRAIQLLQGMLKDLGAGKQRGSEPLTP